MTLIHEAVTGLDILKTPEMMSVRADQDFQTVTHLAMTRDRVCPLHALLVSYICVSII